MLVINSPNGSVNSKNAHPIPGHVLYFFPLLHGAFAKWVNPEVRQCQKQRFLSNSKRTVPYGFVAYL